MRRLRPTPRGLAQLLLLATVVAAHPARAQARQAPPADSARADRPRAEVVDPGSPRASLGAYLRLTRAGDYAAAAQYLDLPDSLAERGPALARELKAVLDRHVWIELGDVSAAAAGDTTDGLPRGTEQVAAIRGADGISQPVRLTRIERGGEGRWVFSRATVERVPVWYAALGDRWMHERLPAALLRPGPLELLWWQWLAIPVLLVVSIAVGTLLGKVVRALFARAARRTASDWDDAVVARLSGPIAVLSIVVVASALIPLLGLYAPAERIAFRIVRAGFLLTFFWGLWRLVEVMREVAGRSQWAARVPSSRALLPLGARVAKVMLAAIAIVAVLSLLGYPVASLVAGLGLGGLALALAAQKTVENLFGAFSIGVDQPFREGDFVKIEDFVGTVERIGLRSTRFRTLDRTIVSIPNGRLADMRLESFTARDRMRLATIIRLVYETTGEQLRAVLTGLEQVLRAHPKIWPDAVVVRLQQIGTSSFDIEVMAWFQTPDWGEFQLIRQEVLLQFMEVVERAGTSFALPAQTLHVASVPPSSTHD